MRPALLSRTLHKWLSLFLGLQLVLWTISGFYMVVVDLDFIHGDPLVRNLKVPLSVHSDRIPFAEAVRSHSEVTQVSLRSLPGMVTPVYEVTTRGRKVLLDASNGQQLSPLADETIK